MRRLWIAVAILVAVFAATLLNSGFLGRYTAQVTAILAQAEQRAEQGDWTTAGQLTREAQDSWRAHEKYLYTVLRHSDLDNIQIGFGEVEEFITCQEGGEYSAASARLITQIELIAEMERFSLQNLL